MYPRFKNFSSRKPKIEILKSQVVIDKSRIMGYFPRFIVLTMGSTLQTLVYRIIVRLACHTISGTYIRKARGQVVMVRKVGFQFDSLTAEGAGFSSIR